MSRSRIRLPRLWFLVSASFLLAAGNSGRMATAAAGQSAAPSESSLWGGAVYIGTADLEEFPPLAAFILQFDTPMAPASSPIPLMSFPYAAGAYQWSADETVLTFQPSSPLASGSTYTFFLDPMLETAAGENPDETQQWIAKVEEGPAVVSITPAPGALKDRKPDAIAIKFDRPMDRARTEEAFSIRPAVRYLAAWKDGGTLEVTVLEPLTVGQRYDFIVSGAEGTAAAAGADGVGMTEDAVWSYWVDPPQIDVKTTGKDRVEVDFHFPLNPSATGLPFEISPPLEGSWTWVTDFKVSFQSADPIPYGQRFTVRITGPLADSYGPLPRDIAEFSFAAAPPVRIEELPKDYGDRVDIEVPALRIIFAVPVDHASAEAAFRISPDVGGTISWLADTPKAGQETMVFHPGRLLDSGTAHTVSILPSLRDGLGQALLVDPVEMTFETSTYYEWNITPTFGIGSDIQLVDAGGSRKIQFGAPDGAKIQFALYGIAPAQFVELYTGRYGNNSLRITTDLMPVPAPGKAPEASWEYSDPGAEDNAVVETVIPAEIKPGLYILNLTYDGRLYDQLFLILSRNTLTLKLSGNEVFVWLTDVAGKSVAGADIQLYSDRGEAIRRGVTDRNGICRILLPEGTVPMLVTARKSDASGPDITLAGISGQFKTVVPRSWNYPYDGSPYRYRAYIYTERPIYRPGQTVFFKAVVRKDHDALYELLPAGSLVTVNVRDGRKTLVQTLSLKTNGFGTVEGSITLSPDAVLGEYTIETVVNGESTSQTFMVEDYRKPDYSAAIHPVDPGRADRVIAGTTFELAADVEYFFGEPVAGARVTVEVYYLDTYYNWFASESGWTEESLWYSSYMVKHTCDSKTDADGRARIHLTLGEISREEGRWNWTNSMISATYAVQVTVDGGDHQPVSAAYVFTAYSASEIIDVANGGYFQRPGQPFTVRAVAEDITGKPVEGRALTLEVEQWDREASDLQTLEEYDLTTDGAGRAGEELTLPSGYFELRLSGKDANGVSMEDTTWVFVFSSQDDWFNRTETEVEIVADRDAYKPGETARFAIESTFSGPAMLTFERGHVLHSMPVELTAPLTVVEAEVRADYAPNVFVTVNAWQPSQFVEYDEYDYTYWGSNHPDSHLRLASTELQVDASSKELRVAVSTDREEYSPGQSMAVTIEVTDAAGRGAAAEVSLAVVDESIFALQEELSPNILPAFYGARRRSVLTYDSMSPDRIILNLSGGLGGGGDSPLGALPRSDFKDTAAWYPSLRTDAGGRLTVTVALPDNLTSWRLTAKAVTWNSLVGEGRKNVVVKKDLVIRPVLPGMLTTGDQTEITAFVHNYSADRRYVTVKLQAEGLRLLDKDVQWLWLEAGEVLPVRWPVAVEGTAPGEAVFSVSAAEGLSDTVRLPVAIQRAATTAVSTQSGGFTGNARIVFSVPRIVPGGAHLTLQLSRSMSGSLLGGLEYLTGYPYGCIEQTMSRALPNAVVGRAAGLLGLGDPSMPARLDPLIRASLQRLVNFQHPDGGWGWWYDDASTDYQTAWVLFGLAQIEEAGYAVAEDVFDGAAGYLTADLGKMDIRTRAFALYSMAFSGRGDLAAAQSLADTQRNALDPFSQAALALALHELGDAPRARSVMDEVARHAVRGRLGTYWPQDTSDGEYGRKTMASTVRSTALVLDALASIDPKSELIPGTVNYLLGRRRGNLGWGTTNETAFTLLALTDYLVQQARQSGESPFTVNVNGKLLSGGTLRTGANTVTIAVPAEQLSLGVNILTLSSVGAAALYYDLSAEFDVPADTAAPAGAIPLTRRYLDPKTGQALTRIVAGQLVEVELAIQTPADASYLIIEDRLPGGLEALNENLNTAPYFTGDAYADTYGNPYRWEDLGYNYKEIRGGRVAFFVTDLPRGKHIYTYLARAVSAGTFLALPAEMYAMYDLKLWGRSASSIVAVAR